MQINLKKYKIKYSNFIKKYKGGSTNEIILQKDLSNLNKPFDKSIFIKYLSDYSIIKDLSNLKEKVSNELISKININPDEFEFSDSEDIIILDFYNNCYNYFITELTKQIDNKKISDHSAISYTINDINILSINLLDDTFGILIMLLANDFMDDDIKNIKTIYILAITKAFNHLRKIRMNKILDLIKEDTEIICFQEVNLEMLDILKKKLNDIGFDKNVMNKAVDRYIRNGEEKERHQYRVIFYKNNQQPIISGEFDFTDKGQVFIIYKNILISCIHITWKLNLNGDSNMKKNSSKLAKFIKDLIEFSNKSNYINKIIHETDILNFNKNICFMDNFIIGKNTSHFNKILLIGDTNNSANNLQQAIEKNKDMIPLDEIENITIHETDNDDETFFVKLNGTNKPDNAIEINLKNTF